MKNYLKNILVIILSLTMILSSTFITSAKAPSSLKCTDLKVVFADGSGAMTGNGTDENYVDFRNAVNEVLRTTTLSYEFYELGSGVYVDKPYNAISIGIDNLDNLTTMLGAYISSGRAYDFYDSVLRGVNEVDTYIKDVSEKCPNTRFIIGGLSQGAFVISEYASKAANADKIIYAATFGDPKLYLPEGKGLVPAACRGENLSEYRLYVPDCHAYEGILGGTNPYQTSAFKNKLGAWCNYHDVVCSSYVNIFNINEDSFYPHGSYGTYYHADHLYDDAAKVILDKINEYYGFSSVSSREKQTNDVAILIDTTGSMSDLIEKYKREAMRLATEVFENNGRVALYEYRDLSDPFLPVEHCNFETCTIEKFKTELNGLTVANGGDDDESLLSASLNAMNKLSWKKGAKKSIIVLTDAGYHSSELFEGNTLTLKSIVDRSLEIDPVNFYTITPSDIMDNYRDLVEQTGGKSFDATGELNFTTDYILSRPDAKLALENYYGEVGEEFLFDASATTADVDIESFEWDLDFDGVFEEKTTSASIKHSYNEIQAGTIQVKVTDKNKMIGTMSAKVNVLEKTKEIELPKIQNINFEKIGEHELSLKFETNAYRVMLILNGYILGFTDLQEMTIGDVDFEQENMLTLVPYDSEGRKGENAVVSISKNSSKININSENIRAPKCGIGH